MKTFAEYEIAAHRTMNTKTPEKERLAWNALGLAGEAGEVADYLKKVLYHGHLLDRTRLVDEAGDVLWYLAALAQVAGVSLGDIAEANIAKLLRRYPAGFTMEASQARVDVPKGDV